MDKKTMTVQSSIQKKRVDAASCSKGGFLEPPRPSGRVFASNRWACCRMGARSISRMFRMAFDWGVAWHIYC